MIHIFRLLILEILFFCKIFLGNMLVRYRGINNTGVLGRPWTIWKVLRAISSTLKCQFTEHHENEKIRLFGETEHRRPGPGYIKMQNVFPLICLVKTPSIAIWGQKIMKIMKTQFFPPTPSPRTPFRCAGTMETRGFL